MQMLRIIILAFLLSVQTATAAEEKTIKIAAGSLLDGYYILGLKLCRYISLSNEGVNCEVVPTSGSLENLRLLQSNKVDFAFSLANLALESHQGKKHFAATEPFKDMYQLLRLHDEYFTVIVKDDDNILVFADLEGQKISNGPPNSDSSVAYTALEVYYNFKKPPTDIELEYENYAKAFCKSDIDAVMMMTGHPNELVNMITHKCESDFVTIDSNKIDLLVKNNPGFHRVTLKAGGYPGITESQETVAVPAIFVSSKKTDKAIVKNFLNYFNSKVSRFKSSSPMLTDLNNSHFTNGFILPSFEE